MVSVNIKWGKERFQGVEVDPNGTVAAFKDKVHTLSNVPLERQKLMAKGAWKGILKDGMSLSGLKDGAQIMLMGTAEVIKKPVEQTIFVEDMSVSEIAEKGAAVPAGLVNLGNTCYMNSVVECMRYIPEFRKSIKDVDTSRANPAQVSFTRALSQTYDSLDKTLDSIPPVQFVQAMRQAFPQFAQQAPKSGGFMQQDAEEFLSAMMTTVGATTKPIDSSAGFQNAADELFGVNMEQTLTCEESADEPETVSHENGTKLVCNITKDVNHVNEGIKIWLNGQLEKNSDVLGRNAIWKKQSRVDRLPKYLCVQMMRFYWKLTPESRDHTGVKCKMMRPISFPLVLDVYDFCSERLQKELKKGRDLHADQILNEFKDGKSSNDMEVDESETEGLSEEEKRALQEAKAMSLSSNEEIDSSSIGAHLPKNFQGNYELFAVVTHKGRSADSGHYMGWAKVDKKESEEKADTTNGPPGKKKKVEDDDWLCFDDDEVSPCKSEDILKLKGGGDWHMTYLTFYRAKN